MPLFNIYLLLALSTTMLLIYVHVNVVISALSKELRCDHPHCCPLKPHAVIRSSVNELWSEVSASQSCVY
jgi:hypothetical protein